MEKLNCLIVEDQIPAQKTLQGYIEQVPSLQLLNIYISPLEALQDLENRKVDILFLDIHLPKLSGIELLKSLHQPPPTILTTAFSKYAIESYELDVVDYLLKPFSFERFLKAISKIPKKDELTPSNKSQQTLFVRNKGALKKIMIPEIEYIEAKGDFILICTQKKREIANISMQKILSYLDESFVRCHKSFIINTSKIDKIIGNHIVLADHKIPIGRTYKEELLERIKLI